MTERPPYSIPAGFHRVETEVARSRFIASVASASTVDDARAFLAQIRAEMPDASHHVYAFRVGYGQSVTEGMSDDGEPTGTSGPPVLAVLRGSGLGDIVIVITRYFGGTKLGTGGLVRAYSEAAHTALNNLKTEEKIEKRSVGLDVPYNLFQPIKNAILKYNGVIEEETFAADVTILATFPLAEIKPFTAEAQDISAGNVQPVILEDE
jgi:uncharacterized YigZ family protein